MFRLLRNTTRTAVVVGGLGTATLCQASSSFPFDTKGSREKHFPPSGLGTGGLSLASVGMRRKNLYVVEVDVYLASLYLGPEALAAAKAAKRTDSSLAGLSDALAATTITKTTSATAQVAINLKFVRDVAQKSVVEAFNDAFKGLDATDVSAFKRSLGEVIGDSGMKTGESITFYWLNSGGGLVVEKNAGTVSSPVKSPDLERRLLEVYTKPSSAVSPELINVVKEHIQCIV